MQLLILYTMMFIAVFDLHAQAPMLSPFAQTLGATPLFIGWMTGIYALTHIPGNLLAGHIVDRFGGKFLIFASLLGTGALMMMQSVATTPEQLLIIRALCGWTIAFLSPACLAMLAHQARTSAQQSTLMSTQGIVQTIASITSPMAGAWLVHAYGFRPAFCWLGAGMFATAIMTTFLLKKSDLPIVAHRPTNRSCTQKKHTETSFAIPFACACVQSIVYFEIPLLSPTSVFTQGLQFGILSIGALGALGLSFLFRHQPPQHRIFMGGWLLVGSVLGIAIVPAEYVTPWLLVVGFAKGIVFPAIATSFAIATPRERYGRIFARLSIVYSLGAFCGPILSGHFRDIVSPFVGASVGLLFLLFFYYKRHRNTDLTYRENKQTL